MKKGLNKEERYYLGLLRMNKYTGKDIYDAYKTPSTQKIVAYYAIKRECDERNGYGVCVLSHNCSFFTAGYFYPDPITRETRARIELPTRTLDFAVVE